MADSPRIYVASLTDYNAGTLHGAWIDAAQTADAIQAEVGEMLAASPTAQDECYSCGLTLASHGGDGWHAFMPSAAEEWAIHDYEGFGSLRLSEYESFEDVSEWARMIEEHGEAWIAFADNGGAEYADEERFEESYQGSWRSEEELAEELGAISGDADWPYTCIDWELAARDLFCGDYWSARVTDGTLYIFRSI